MPVVIIALALLALLGHAAWWVGYVNRAHSVGASRRTIKLLSTPGHALLVFVPLAAFGFWLSSGKPLVEWLSQIAEYKALWFYLIPCWILAVLVAALWVHRYWLTPQPKAVLSNRTTIVDVAQQLGRQPIAGFKARLFSHVPGNQFLQLAVEQREFALSLLPTALDGFSITHLTDLHFTGRIGPEYFSHVVQQANALRSDLVAITGDILDDLEFLEWIPAVLSNLAAPLGVYFVLGNHDEFTGDASRVRQALVAAGLIDMGNRWQRLEARETEIILAGNEVPWFKPVPDLQSCPPRSADHPQLRLLLSHTPDQWPWARRFDFDLMLAGHTHGGQIRIPLVGPIFAPSWHGAKYASGTFYAAPTLMHVSRGVSAELPLRLNCRPELSKIVLRRK